MKRFEYVLLTATAFPLYFHHDRFHQFYKDLEDKKFLNGKEEKPQTQQQPKEQQFETKKMQQIQSICQIICVSTDIGEEMKPFTLSLFSCVYHVVPFQLKDRSILLSCIIVEEDPVIVADCQHEYLMSYVLLQRFLASTSPNLFSFLKDLTQFQENKAKESTFNDSTGGLGGSIYDERYLEELFIQYSLHDAIAQFEENYINDLSLIQGLFFELSLSFHDSYSVAAIYLFQEENYFSLFSANRKSMVKKSSSVWKFEKFNYETDIKTAIMEKKIIYLCNPGQVSTSAFYPIPILSLVIEFQKRVNIQEIEYRREIPLDSLTLSDDADWEYFQHFIKLLSSLS